MGQRGRIANPNSIRYQNRTKPERTMADIPRDELGTARMPSHLEGDARAFWKAHAPRLRQLGRLTTLDQISFAMVCESYALLRQIDAQIERDGFVTMGPRGGMRQHPLLKTRTSWWKAFLDGLRQFGLTPTSRARLPAPPVAQEPDDFEAYLSKKNGANG